MARKTNEVQEPKKRSQKPSTKITLSTKEKNEMVNISKKLGEQTTFNTDPISELIVDGEIENAI